MNKNTSVEVSIVTPMHNEQLCIREFHNRVVTTLQDMKVTFEIILVDDGSTDKTGEILRELSEKDHHVTAVFLSRNRGQCTAIYAGIQHTQGLYVVIMDGDLQHKPEEIPLLVTEMKKGYDLVSGRRYKRKESLLFRRIPSKIANFLIRRSTKCGIHDMGGFNCINGEIARSLRLRAGQHRILPALVHLMGGAVTEVPVSAPVRLAGKSHYGMGRALDVLFDVVMLWFQTSFKQRPLYLFGRISLFFFVFASAIMIWILYEKIMHGVDMGTRPPFLGAILFYFASLSFMSTGFVLEMLATTLDTVTGTMPYVVREIGKSKLREKTISPTE